MEKTRAALKSKIQQHPIFFTFLLYLFIIFLFYHFCFKNIGFSEIRSYKLVLLWFFLSFLASYLSVLTFKHYNTLKRDTLLDILEKAEIWQGDVDQNSDKLPQNIKQFALEVRKTFYCRRYAAERLRNYNFWIQTISIYYSCFTAALAIFSLVTKNIGGENASAKFLTLPSVLFTIMVAILVTYANAQNCAGRAADLNANCRDLANVIYEITDYITYGLNDTTAEKAKLAEDLRTLIENNPTAGYPEMEELISQIKWYRHPPRTIDEIKNDFTGFLKDSEDASAPDRWRYDNYLLYLMYILAYIAFIIVFFAIPIIFIYIYHNNFITLFCNPK